MRFDDRVILLFEVTKDGLLDDEVIRETENEVPCVRTSLSHNEQIGLFGNYDLTAFKLHLDGNYDGFTNIIYRGVKRKVKTKIHHDHSTVVIV